MADNSFFGAELRPDQARTARLGLGMASPMWLPFMAAASMGAAFWMVQNWSRMGGAARANGLGAAEGAGRSNRPGASAGTETPDRPQPAARPAPAQPSPAAVAPQPSASLPAAVRRFAEDASASLSGSLAVQGADAAEAPSPVHAVSTPAAQRTQAPPPKPKPKPKSAPKSAAVPRPGPGGEQAARRGRLAGT